MWLITGNSTSKHVLFYFDDFSAELKRNIVYTLVSLLEKKNLVLGGNLQ